MLYNKIIVLAKLCEKNIKILKKNYYESVVFNNNIN